MSRTDKDLVATGGAGTADLLARASTRLRQGVLADRWVARTVLAGAAWLVFYAVAVAIADGDLARKLVSDVVYQIPLAAAAALTWAASIRASGRDRLFWRLLAIGVTGWLGGEITWAVIELGLGREVPTPSLADPFYLVWYAAIIPAVLLAFWPAVRTRAWRTLLDASVMAAAIGVAGYELLIGPQLGYGLSLETLTGIAYPALDVAVLIVLTGVVHAARGTIPAPIRPVALACAVAALADGVYTYSWVSGSYDPGSWIDLGWQLQAVLVAVGAVAGMRDRRPARTRVRPVQGSTGVPIALGVAAILTSLFGAGFFGEMPRAVDLLAVVAVAAVVVRLVLTARENAAAAHRLDRQNRTLAVQARALETSIGRHERVERELERSVTMLTATLESTADAILVVDGDGLIVGSNANFRELWRLPQEVLDTARDGSALRSVLDQLVDPDGFVDRIQELYADPHAESFDVIEFLDGRIVERVSKPQRVPGSTGGRVWSFRDVTERVQLEQELRHAQKMDAVGRLAGGVAHDFNNLLTAIRGYGDLLLMRLEDPAARRSAEEIQRAADRAAALTGQLLAFSRKQVLQPSVVDLDELVDGMRGLLAPLVGEAIELTVTPSPGGAHVVVDGGQLDQVIVNLVVNARDALEGCGRIELETEVSHGEVLLRVRDDGHGMDEPTLAQAFEPFFTTKPSGSGTGLGLATVLGIVEQSDGRIDVRTRPGEGTTVEIALPAVVVPAADPEPLDERAPHRARHATILLAEDEAIVRDLLHAVLVDAGFDVLAAANGEEALELSRRAGEIDLLLTDAVMPRMSGGELAEHLAAERPGTRVVYMSGYTDDPVLRRVREAGEPFLQKPFSPAELVETLRERLGEPALV